MVYVYNSELYHFGIPGMKWGHRKAVAPTVSVGRRRGVTDTNSTRAGSDEQRAKKVERRKKALKIGAAVAGTALAAYGTYKLSKFVQNKRYASASRKAEEYLKANILTKGETFKVNGKKRVIYKNANNASVLVDNLSRRESRKLDKTIRNSNYKVVNEARNIYYRNTNTKLDKGLAKIVNTGDSIGRAAKTTGRVAVGTGRAIGKAAKTTGRVAVGTGRTIGKVAKTAAKRPKTTAAIAIGTAAVIQKEREERQRRREQQNRNRYQ